MKADRVNTRYRVTTLEGSGTGTEIHTQMQALGYHLTAIEVRNYLPVGIRTRDLAVRDSDGYYWYRGRNDDLIKSAGYRIGPVEVEEVLMRHPAVAEVAVISVPDSERGQLVQACIVLARGHAASEALVNALRDQVRQALGPYKVPRKVVFVDALSHTTTGKLSRAQLRQQFSAAMA